MNWKMKSNFNIRTNRRYQWSYTSERARKQNSNKSAKIFNATVSSIGEEWRRGFAHAQQPLHIRYERKFHQNFCRVNNADS